jgi:hypothetical protein
VALVLPETIDGMMPDPRGRPGHRQPQEPADCCLPYQGSQRQAALTVGRLGGDGVYRYALRMSNETSRRFCAGVFGGVTAGGAVSSYKV